MKLHSVIIQANWFPKLLMTRQGRAFSNPTEEGLVASKTGQVLGSIANFGRPCQA